MATQVFKAGDVAYVKHWGDRWEIITIADPPTHRERQSRLYGSKGTTEYVRYHYKGRPNNQLRVRNARNLIATAERYANEIKPAIEAKRAARKEREAAQDSERHAIYESHARKIIELAGPHTPTDALPIITAYLLEHGHFRRPAGGDA